MRLLFGIAMRHLLARTRQSVVSLMGIVLGVGFFLAISSLMRGSEKDFIHRLVDNVPHITIMDEYRNPREQPAEQVYRGAVEIRSVKPLTETRGIRGFNQVLAYLRDMPGVEASPILSGQGVLSFAGRTVAIAMDGMIPQDIRKVITIEKYMVSGSVDELIANPNGIFIGQELARVLSLSRGNNITITAPNGQVRVFKIVGTFRTGRSEYDLNHSFVSLKRMQAFLDRPNRASNIIIKLDDPYAARDLAAQIERRIGYKCVSWQEASQDILDTLMIRNIIMYTVVSAVLLVAAFGIYNVISTVVLEKQRDIAILKSMGFRAGDIKTIFVMQGAVLGVAGCLIGLPFGTALMRGMMHIHFKIPGEVEAIPMPIDWGVEQFAIAGIFALCAATIAAWLPARKAAHLQPVDILRGGA